VRSTPSTSGCDGPERNRHQVQQLGETRRLDADSEVTRFWNVAHSYGKTATFMPKPVVGDNGSGMHVHQSVWKTKELVVLGATATRGCPDFAYNYIAASSSHAKALNAITNPGPIRTSVWCRGSRRRSTSPTRGTVSPPARPSRHNPKARRVGSALPRPDDQFPISLLRRC